MYFYKYFIFFKLVFVFGIILYINIYAYESVCTHVQTHVHIRFLFRMINLLISNLFHLLKNFPCSIYIHFLKHNISENTQDIHLLKKLNQQ